MTRKIALAMVGLIAAALAATLTTRRRRASVPASDREEQQTQAGTPVVEEWGYESFPASDPPQSW